MTHDDITMTVLRMLRNTAPRELDCDEFVDAMAPLLDDRLGAEDAALVAHHRQLCPECDEQAEILKRALDDQA